MSVKKFIKEAANNKFFRNVAIVASGAAGAQVITLISAPLITRLYGPEAFGILGVFMSVLNILVPIAALTYPIAIVLPKEEKDAEGIACLSFFVALSMSGLATVILSLYGNYFIELLGMQKAGGYLYFIPVGMLAFAFLQVAQQWLIRKKEFLLNARVSIVQAVIINITKISAGFIYPAASILIVISVFGAALNFLMLMVGVRNKNIKSFSITSFSQPKSIIKVGKAHKDFPLYRAPQMLINEISQNFPVLILSMLFGPAYAGFFTLSKTVMILPVSLIGKSVGDVLYPRINEAAHKRESISLLLRKATSVLVLVGVLPFTIVIIFGPQIFSIAFGSDWDVAGQYAQWLALWMFFMLIVNPSVKAMPILKAQRFHLVYTCLLTIIRILAMLVGYYLYSSDLYAVALYSLCAVVGNMLLIFIIDRKAIQYDISNRLSQPD
ncbi:lipopolysaccharide biosynthesis protein [Halomonas sp. WWR20]